MAHATLTSPSHASRASSPRRASTSTSASRQRDDEYMQRIADNYDRLIVKMKVLKWMAIGWVAALVIMYGVGLFFAGLIVLQYYSIGG